MIFLDERQQSTLAGYSTGTLSGGAFARITRGVRTLKCSKYARKYGRTISNVGILEDRFAEAKRAEV